MHAVPRVACTVVKDSDSCEIVANLASDMLTLGVVDQQASRRRILRFLASLDNLFQIERDRRSDSRVHDMRMSKSPLIKPSPERVECNLGVDRFRHGAETSRALFPRIYRPHSSNRRMRRRGGQSPPPQDLACHKTRAHLEVLRRSL